MVKRITRTFNDIFIKINLVCSFFLPLQKTFFMKYWNPDKSRLNWYILILGNFSTFYSTSVSSLYQYNGAEFLNSKLVHYALQLQSGGVDRGIMTFH